MEKRKKANSVDVAKLAGVSQASVSRAFSPNGSISAAKKEKILAAAKQLGYVPNEMARALISSYSNCIAIVQPIAHNSQFYSKVLQQLLELLRTEHQRVVLFNQDEKGVDEILPLIDQYQVDGVILASANIDAKLINQYVNRGIEFSFINRHVPNVYASSICTNNKKAAKQLVEHLHNKGHRTFVCFTGSQAASTAIDRALGYQEKIAELGLYDIGVDYDEFSVDSGYKRMRDFIKSGAEMPNAIVCGNDEIAIGVINAIKEYSDMRIPQDIAITGFDDIDSSSWLPYSLTTVKQPIEELCQLTVSDLLHRIRNSDTAPVNESLDGIVVTRTST